jgi:hypothetical protein
MTVENDDEVYDDSVEEKRTEKLEDDEISPEEEGFMKGYDEAYESEETEDKIDKEFE